MITLSSSHLSPVLYYCEPRLHSSSLNSSSPSPPKMIDTLRQYGMCTRFGFRAWWVLGSQNNLGFERFTIFQNLF